MTTKQARWLAAMAVGITALAWSAGARAGYWESVPVGNASFEEVYTDASETTPVTLASGMGTYDPGFGNTQIFGGSPTSGFVPDWTRVAGTGPYSAGEYNIGISGKIGVNVAYIGEAGAQIQQTLGDTFADGAYALSVKLWSSANPNSAFAVELLAGGNALIPTSATTPTVSSAWNNGVYWTLNYSATDFGNGAYLGLPLAIRLGATGAYAGQLYFDDVSLEHFVPEPASGMLLALAGALALRRRR